MSLISRIQCRFTRITRTFPVFQAHSRGMDFNEKGKAEENVYFRKEQERLLTKLRKLFTPQQKDESPTKAVDATKSVDKAEKK